ncbi:hypothetical protein E1263_12960 [Kribbella antibiotica]|uniref:Wadjet protein JetD C-terminal domain-containing protein n=1 Tax=Kribbella antibiotica TaxID=190195 RepID=A0A4R4ZMD4_9ACTN|nr:Wadjet anti-phage system protein JetD domain-containing protein [Kribbella antibiotica]TDD60001.1 hypothetical protein E1263_12960 [Kribbella antibiotica]
MRSALAQRLADGVAASSTQQVSLDVLYDAAVAFDRSLASAPTARAEIRGALDELVAAGLLTFPVSPAHFDVREVPRLPLWVRRPPRGRTGREGLSMRVWPAALEAAGQIATQTSDLDVLEAVSAFLRSGGAQRPSVPARERSLQLFGDEKRLDSLTRTRLFTSGALTLDLLRCHPVPIPFVSQWVEGQPDPRGVALLIAENHHTYTSLLEITRSQAAQGGPQRHVGYGTGSQFPSAVLTVPLLKPRPKRIVYFGDVDLKGLQIPASADRTAQQANLPPVTPAWPLYELLFDVAPRRSTTEIPADSAADAARWLGPLASSARELLITGLRLPQEAVGHERLTDHPNALLNI